MWFFVLFVGWPLLEIALFVLIGGQIGIWATLLWVLLTAMLGVAVMRWQMARQAVALRDMRNPAQLAAAGAMGLVGGMLLILPGFFTDALGLLMLLPPVQAMVVAAIARRVQVVRAGTASAATSSAEADDIVDAEYTEVPPKGREGGSGWTRIE